MNKQRLVEFLEPEVKDGETEALFKGTLSVVRKAVDVLLSLFVSVPVIPEVWQAALFCSPSATFSPAVVCSSLPVIDCNNLGGLE